MLKLGAAFAFGIIVAIATVTLLGWRPPHAGLATVEQNSVSRKPDKQIELTSVEDVRPVSSRDTAPIDNREASVSNVEPVIAPATAKASVRPESTSASSGSASRQTANTTRDDYPPEIAFMIENRTDRELLDRYERDEREESWATYMEGQIKEYFAQKPALSQFYFSKIGCRTSICQVHALGYGVDALGSWNGATADLTSQPWMEFNSMSMDQHNPEPDVLGIVLILTKPPN